MLKNIKKDYMSWMILIGGIVLLLEILFFNKGLIFSLFVSAGMIYLGQKRSGRRKTKVLFWAGIIFFCISVFSMMTFRFFLLAVLLHFFIQYYSSKKNPKKIAPEFVESEMDYSKETVISSEPLLENVIFGQQKTPNHVFEWDDINIQAGVGDTVIDLSYTVLPKGETVIFIRNIIGNIQILIPYDIDVSVHHSVIAGKTTMFDEEQSKIFNKAFHMKTSGYNESEQKVKIFTSLLVGNLEVKRI